MDVAALRPAGVISSDHPISTVPWTRDPTSSVGAPSELVLGSLEVRVAVSPTTALLLTWADADDRVDVVRAAQHHLRAFNRGAWEQAERHRFWQPGTTPRGVDDGRPATPISAELFRGYDAKSSARLDAALAWYQGRLREQQAGVEDRAVVIAWMEQTDRGLRVVPARYGDEHAAAFGDFAL